MMNQLEKCEGPGCTWKVLREEVYTFGMEGRFLYVSKVTSDPYSDSETTRVMEVSSDGGNTWNEVQLPTITSDRFYSILDMNEKMIFMHVDNPGDTGHGTLYISDATGIIFSESLQRHLYPNFIDVTDFYRVLSMRGVYLASQMEHDDSIHTMITYDRGGIWQPVPRPEGVPCKTESKRCNLQIHNRYSVVNSINAQLPLSSENAVGIILVHGHVADVLQNSDPDVFVSSDGGYSWRLALKGPHHYQIADQGGLLVAVPSDTLTPKVIKFSTDEGRCWHEYEFTRENIVFKRLLTEPGNTEMSVAIWGYHQDTNMWKTIVIDFRSVLARQCFDDDYETWTAHFDNSKDPAYAGCLLGVKETFSRLKKDSWCYNGHSKEIKMSEQSKCSCTEADYDCDYGYYRSSGSGMCRLDPAFKGSELDICLRGHMEELVNVGYHKMPGDVCEGGFTPTAPKTIKMKERCVEGDKSWVADETHQTIYKSKKNVRLSTKSSAQFFTFFLTVLQRKEELHPGRFGCCCSAVCLCCHRVLCSQIRTHEEVLTHC
ncbi:hypothetical protein CAPTEDRAFT_178911 [Capitella teleta]|uniref:VPS10 domain-containing protein n=1 Tax=Capitella teleta TaxID=283909 RepID=R7TLM8_CAPTE|nr:hypothetical protein CAPTEDRAFT_178911 [Capitella teleta]|eukprot:ELT94733.1 hypothetical protein CAPTEDRAFT_178911 [Capitella teleta]